jgi:hypothetical protein
MDKNFQLFQSFVRDIHDPYIGFYPLAAHLPIGVQLIAAPWREDHCLRVAAQLQAQGLCSAAVARGL